MKVVKVVQTTHVSSEIHLAADQDSTLPWTQHALLCPIVDSPAGRGTFSLGRYGAAEDVRSTFSLGRYGAAEDVRSRPQIWTELVSC